MPAFSTATLALFGTLGWPEMLILGILGVLIFGKRLPEVGKSLGKGIVEFKKGLSGVEDDVDEAVKRNRDLENPLSRQTTLHPSDKVETPSSPTV